ncbi:MAG TPA: hypothetical protein VJQ56_11510 [Blastocatellia bacterium]|nr:hypothetical protein [Blastocatellia bacterium]
MLKSIFSYCSREHYFRFIIVSISATCIILLAGVATCAASSTLSSISLSTFTVTGGEVVQGTISLSARTKKRRVIILSVSNPSAAAVPEKLIIPARAASATFSISTRTVEADVPVTIAATNKGVTLSTALTVTAPQLPPLPPTPHAGNQFYVAPKGSSSGNGSKDRPWDLQTALSHPASVKPGDTIWLRGGVYTKAWTSNRLYQSRLTGTSDKPVILRQYPGERAVIDAGSSPAYKDYHALRIDGAHTYYWGFEVMYSERQRRSQQTGSSPSDLRRGRGVTIYGNNIKCINLVVHDAAIGFSFWTPGENSELYGCIVFYNGWESDRGHGHGIYAHNEVGTKRVTNCILFKQFRNGIQVYNDDADDFINNVVLEGNIVFENGALSASGYARDILYGGNGLAVNPVISNNCTYTNPSVDRGENNLGYDAGTENAKLTGNYFVSGGSALEVVGSVNLSMKGNTFFGRVGGVTQSQYGDNAYHRSRMAGVKTFVRPNLYEPGRGHIAVYNWDELNAVSVDISSVGLQIGDAYEVMDVQNYFGAPVAAGIYDGKPVTLPMNLSEVTLPVGSDVPVAAKHTSKEFGAFVVRRR